jgi:hypothetical protein
MNKELKEQMRNFDSRYGLNLVFGVRDMRPIYGAPPGRQRLRMRNDEFASLFVKTHRGIRHFMLLDCGDHWKPHAEQARNMRSVPACGGYSN